MRPPAGLAFPIKLFHLPRTTRSDDLRQVDSSFQAIQWAVMPEGYPINRDLELRFARALVAVDTGEYLEALNYLSVTDGAHLSQMERQDLTLSLAETMMALGDNEGVIRVLRPYFDESIQDPRVVLICCWLYVVLLDSGFQADAQSVRAFIEAKAFGQETALVGVFVLQVANFMAYYGDFELAERALHHWCRLPPEHRKGQDSVSVTRMAVAIAQGGLRASSAHEWGRSLGRPKSRRLPRKK